jgi:hypothetical protein
MGGASQKRKSSKKLHSICKRSMSRGTPAAAGAPQLSAGGIMGSSRLDILPQSTISRGPPIAANPDCTCSCNPARLDKRQPKVAVSKLFFYKSNVLKPAPLISAQGVELLARHGASRRDRVRRLQSSRREAPRGAPHRLSEERILWHAARASAPEKGSFVCVCVCVCVYVCIIYIYIYIYIYYAAAAAAAAALWCIIAAGAL